MAADQLICPTCGAAHPADERFCRDCGIPLVHAERPSDTEPVSARREHARKIKPQFTEGELVRVAGARHQAEAELIQGLLLEEGVPSMLRRTRGFDVPDLLAAGPRDVLVPAAAEGAARDVLLQAELLRPGAGSAVECPARLLGALIAAVAVVAVLAWLGTELL